jgi:hypothetical protein
MQIGTDPTEISTVMHNTANSPKKNGASCLMGGIYHSLPETREARQAVRQNG